MKITQRRRRTRGGRPLAAWWLVPLALAALLGPHLAEPAVFPNLYTLTVSPEGGVGDRAAAIDLAMRRLLTRITGDRDAGNDPDLQDMVANAARYVESFAVPDRQTARVSFYATEIERELEARNRSVWGPERPLTLLWIAIDAGQGDRALVPAEGAPPGATPEMATLIESVREEVEAVAEERGLPITLPLIDIEDMAAVGFADVWGGFEQTISAASTRYGADAILVGRMRVTELGNDVQWLLLRNGERRLFAGEELVDGLHWLAQNYARDFSVVGGLRTVRLLVRDIGSLADYGRVMSYLEGLSALQTIDVESLDDSGLLSLRVAARGDVGVLERMFTLGRVLQLDEAMRSGAEGGNTLVLRMAGAGSAAGDRDLSRDAQRGDTAPGGGRAPVPAADPAPGSGPAPRPSGGADSASDRGFERERASGPERAPADGRESTGTGEADAPAAAGSGDDAGSFR
ncbi:MAG: DUF2066 domain-containing protein [Gammaproteobacteria bacterium]|nr:DUF2066 domain-containing protein [Gammaproteobacteria bacterium]